MKLIIIAALIAATLLTSCNDGASKNRETYTVKKILRSKKEGTETEYHYRYNAFRGKMYEQPDVHTAYYLIYTDGSYDAVDVGKYTMFEPGDTVVFIYEK